MDQHPKRSHVTCSTDILLFLKKCLRVVAYLILLYSTGVLSGPKPQQQQHCSPAFQFCPFQKESDSHFLHQLCSPSHRPLPEAGQYVPETNNFFLLAPLALRKARWICGRYVDCLRVFSCSSLCRNYCENNDEYKDNQ